MARRLTLNEAVVQFGPYVTSGLDARTVVQEAIYRIYEMGRFPGTTEEITLVDDDFTKVDNEYFLYLDEVAYDGMIGFRNDSRGWSIMDQTILYRDGINGGDYSIIDFGTVEVVENGDYVDKRKYRMPLDFSLDGGPFYAFVKIEPPELMDDTVIRIHSVGAMKAAVMAVSYESVSDDDRAMQQWGKFKQLMTLSERQFEGPKKYYVGMDSSLRRKPKQFM